MTKMMTITVEVPANDLQAAQAFTGGSVDETVRAALRDLAAREAQQRLLALKGKVKFAYSISELRAMDESK
ncbi:MAG TPA: hypothetical protein DCL54_06225 [Alphaproteobacteria bacterium]|nr:hypothetical protein [Alphaproteobacteria bacterium]HAJ46159.1 hypothetical protein [Alphaproteobacteria bacterium]